MPKFSVIIPSYNHSAYISEAVLSVLDQSVSDLELIIIDDGSKDDSLKVLSRFSDPRLRIYTQPNQGAHAAINRGLREAQGELLAILNSDDSYHPQRLEKVLNAFEADPHFGLVGSYIRIVNAHNKELGIKHGFQDCEPWALDAPEQSFRAGEDLRDALLTENYWATTSNYVFSRRWYEQVGEFRPLRFAHDWDFALRLSHLAPMRLIPEPLVNYRVHSHNTIRQDQAVMIFEICWILAVHLPLHTAGHAFLQEQPLEKRIQQLLHSIYVFGMDRILNVLLLQRLHEHPELALQLLEKDDPARNVYLEFIEKALELNKGISNPKAQQRSRSTFLDRILQKTVKRAEKAAVVPPDNTNLVEDDQELHDQARLSGDPFKEATYFDQAEASMGPLWDSLIWPLIHKLDFECVVDLAAGHGRNSAKILPHAKQLIIVDINQECVDFCKRRFEDNDKIRFLKNDGVSLNGIPDGSVSLIYSFDSMVHFDSDVLRGYLREFYRVLKPGGHCFCHHSNYTGSPGGNFRQSPHWRNFMSKELFAHYSTKIGLQVVAQKPVDWAGITGLDCITILKKPPA